MSLSPISNPTIPSEKPPVKEAPEQEKHVLIIEKYLLDKDTYTGTLARRYGLKALETYLNTPQPYVIATEPATFSCPATFKINGQMGHHSLMRLPGSRVVELMRKDLSWESRMYKLSDSEVRFAPGRVIEQMWRTHCETIQKYRTLGKIGDRAGWLNYRPFTNDCFDYLNDQILIPHNQKPTTLHRLTQTPMGTFIESMMVRDDYKAPTCPVKKES
jgi:hypothetical protein